MLIRPNIVLMFAELNAEYFDNKIPAGLPIVWNTRMTTTAGYCRYKRVGYGITPSKIDLSDKLFRTMDYNETEIRETLIHEMVHAYLAETANIRGHGWQFQSMMDKITGVRKNHRCHSYDTSTIRRKQEKKIHCECLRCGYTYNKARMPKHAAYGKYTHRNCGGEVIFTKTENSPEGTISIF